MKRRNLLALLTAIACLLGRALAADDLAPAKPDAEEPKFVRAKRDNDRLPLAMETAVVRYSSAARPGVELDLIGAVHIADQSYYDDLNKLFEKYDVVLYELVAPEGTRIPKGGRTGGGSFQRPFPPPDTKEVIGGMQHGMSSILELSHQLNCVDYTKQNFVHADMSPDEFSKAMEDRGESFFQMFLRLMGSGIAQSAS